MQPTGERLPDDYVKAVDLELAQLGYVPSARLRDVLSRLRLEELAQQQRWICETLATSLGANQKHEPLVLRDRFVALVAEVSQMDHSVRRAHASAPQFGCIPALGTPTTVGTKAA